MTSVSLVFGDEHEETRYVCERMRLEAHAVEPEDFVACPYAGFVHVHEVEVREGIVYLTDCYEHEHMYAVHAMVEVARPLAVTSGAES